MQTSLTLHSPLNLSFLSLNDLYKHNSVKVLFLTFCFWLKTPHPSLSMRLIQILQAQLAKAISCPNDGLLIHRETDPKHHSALRALSQENDCIKNNSFFCHFLFYLNDFHSGVNPPASQTCALVWLLGHAVEGGSRQGLARRGEQAGAARSSPTAWRKVHGCVASGCKHLKCHCSHRPPHTPRA